MHLSTKISIRNFLSGIREERREQYRLGIVDFVVKLEALIVVLEQNDKEQISYYLHSVKPLSQMLKLDELQQLLDKISDEDDKQYPNIVKRIKQHIDDVYVEIGKL